VHDNTGCDLNQAVSGRDQTCQSLLFSLVMGVAGGFLPAIRAARLKIVDALRAI